MYRSNRGFTLVELLVVITIIGILVALIIPAVNAVRESGRQTVCLNNQIQMAKAILTYETAKNHLPGVLNQGMYGTPPTAVTYTWVEAILPYLERVDLWEMVCNNGIGSAVSKGQVPTLKVAICPNDPWSVDPTSTNYQGLLSYGVNDQFFVSYVSSSGSLASPPVDRTETNPVSPAILSKLTTRPNNPSAYLRGEPVSSSTTIMIGERTGDGSTTYPRAWSTTSQTAGPWTTTPASAGSAAAAWTALTFQWPPQPAPGVPSTVQISPTIMVSNHPGKVIVVFFDGHGDKVNTDTMYPQ